MRYAFCVLALLVQPVFGWYVWKKQDKNEAALKMPMLFYSVVYLIVQMFVFWKYCIKIPEYFQMWSYVIQAVILIVFIFLELLLFGSNKYIKDVEEKERKSVKEFKELITELDICRAQISDPVSSPAVQQENLKIHELIMELSEITDSDLFAKKCDEITKQLDIRKTKNTKE